MKANEIKRGYVVEHNGQAYIVRGLEKSVPTARGGNTTYRFILNRVPGGQKLDLSLRGDDELKEIDLAKRPSTFSYKDGEAFVFMDNEDFTPYTLDADVIDSDAGYITEALEGAYVLLIEGLPVGIELPQSVVLEVIETPPELKGSSATKRTKPAKLTTGLEIQVPEYIVNGEKVKVNTETGEFSGRAG